MHAGNTRISGMSTQLKAVWGIALLTLIVVAMGNAQERKTFRDAIILKSGETFVGTLVESASPDTVLLQVGTEVRAFPRITVATITKENALRGYVPPGEKIDPRFLVSFRYGFDLTDSYGKPFGVSIGYLFGTRLFAELSFMNHSGITKTGAPTLHYRIGFTTYSYKTSLTEKTGAAVFNLQLGMQLGRGDLQVRPYAGVGIASMKSDIVYHDTTFEDWRYDETFDDAPERGTVTRISIPLGISFTYRVVGPLVLGIDIHQQFIASLGGKASSKEYLSFIEKNENVTTVALRVNLEW
jgi:hypothetical protein